MTANIIGLYSTIPHVDRNRMTKLLNKVDTHSGCHKNDRLCIKKQFF